MKRILIFSGTTEGRELAEFLRNRQVDVIVSVATEYGRDCMDVESSSNVSVRTGRMDEAQIRQFLTTQKIDLVVDATHPFAAEVTKNVEQACRMAGTEYIRCVRERQNWDDKGERVVRVESVPEAVEYLQNTTGNVLIATGSKELKEYTRIAGCKERCYARVLSTQVSVEESIRLGFEGKHLIAMQGPFSKELNLAMLTGNVLIATGSKELKEYTRIAGYKERCYARVLSTQVSVEESIRLGFEGRHLIAMQGPFSKELNLAMLRAVDARYFVTKESGKSGGFLEKVQAAEEAKAVLVVVGRPFEVGKILKETKKILEIWAGLC